MERCDLEEQAVFCLVVSSMRKGGMNSRKVLKGLEICALGQQGKDLSVRFSRFGRPWV